MGLFRLLATLLVGFFVAWITLAFQHVAASGSTLGALSVVGLLVGLLVFVLLGFRLVT